MNRIEKKFVIDNGFDADYVFKSICKCFVIKKIFEPRQISTIYLDTKSLDYLNNNLSGIKNRKKARIRFYSNNKSEIIYEEKIKKNNFGFKNKTIIDIDNAKFLDFKTALKKFKESSVFFRYKFFLNETLFVKYNREYFNDLFGNFITLDTKIEFSDPNHFKKMVMYKKSVIEYKINDHNYENNLFYDFKQRNTRHSKYVAGMAFLNRTSYV